MIFNDFFKSIGQMDDPRFRRVIWLGLLLSVALLVAVYSAMLWLLEWFNPGSVEIPLVGPVTWIGDLFTLGSLALIIVMSMFLMVPVASFITSLFLEDVAHAVEDEHYPHLPIPPRVTWTEALTDTLSFAGLLIVANGLAFFLYVAFPFLSPFVFYGLNGFLLGREYFQIAAMRHEGRKGAKALRREHSTEIWMAGVLMALPLTVPILNLVIPVLGAATFTHLYHRVKA